MCNVKGINKNREPLIWQNSPAPLDNKEPCEMCVKTSPNIKTRSFSKVGEKILHIYREHKNSAEQTEPILRRLKQIAIDYHKQTGIK
jgi:hypothetical protein